MGAKEKHFRALVAAIVGLQMKRYAALPPSRRFPALASQVAVVRTAADGVAKNRPLLEQSEVVQRFFASATDVVRAMANRSA